MEFQEITVLNATQEPPRIDILLATYNGARYLPELLASLDAQTETGWRLIARDDGSTDATRAVLDAWSAARPGRVVILDDDRTGLGASGNFAALLAASDAAYFMFCDQDDIWLPDKISRMAAEMTRLEARRGDETPLLVHSDLEVVDGDLRPIDASFWRYQRLFRPMATPPRELLLVVNYVTGCATLGNAALRRAAAPVPNAAALHDWWVALVAGMLGDIADIDEPTVRYRQHGVNAVGAKQGTVRGTWRRFLAGPGAAAQRTRTILSRSQAQAGAFLDRHGSALDPTKRALVSQYAEIGAAGFWRRKTFLIRNRLMPENRLQLGILTWFM